MELKQQLLETNWFHAANFIWLYDATGRGWSSKVGIQSPIHFSVTSINPAQKFQLFNKQERIALLLPKNESLHGQKSKDQLRLVNPLADVSEESLRVTNVDLQMPASQIQSIVGTIDDVSLNYNPRYFSLTLSAPDPKNVATNSIALFKNSARIKPSASGSVFGHLSVESGDALPWAILTLRLKITNSLTLEFRSQSNKRGDFMIPLSEFPALEKDSLATQFLATLSLQLPSLVDGLPDLDQLGALKIKEQAANNFLDSIDFQISPGDQVRLKSTGSQSLVVKS